MSNQEVLEKAVQKAIDGGFDGTPYWTVDFTAQGAAKAIYRYRNPPYEQIIFNHDFAKALWGNEQLPLRHFHVTRSEMPGYVETTFPLHNSDDIRIVQEEDMRCFNCGKVLAGPHWIRNDVCWIEGGYNAGWAHHLQQMVIADDPLQYLADHI